MSVAHPLATKRIKFDLWKSDDLKLASKLWDNVVILLPMVNLLSHKLSSVWRLSLTIISSIGFNIGRYIA